MDLIAFRAQFERYVRRRRTSPNEVEFGTRSASPAMARAPACSRSFSNWEQISHFTAALGPIALTLVWIAIFAAATLVLALLDAARNTLLGITWQQEPVIRSRYLRTAWGTALTDVTVGVIVLLQTPAPDIIYKSF